MTNHAAAGARLERIKKLGQLLAESAANSLQHRELTESIRIEAAAYRKSLDVDQAAKIRDPRPRRTIA
jgi:hypothetical protein